MATSEVTWFPQGFYKKVLRDLDNSGSKNNAGSIGYEAKAKGQAKSHTVLSHELHDVSEVECQATKKRKRQNLPSQEEETMLVRECMENIAVKRKSPEAKARETKVQATVKKEDVYSRKVLFAIDPKTYCVDLSQYQSVQGRHTCQICSQRFFFSNAFHRHLKSHVTDFLVPLECSCCKLVFRGLAAFKNHKCLGTSSND